MTPHDDLVTFGDEARLSNGFSRKIENHMAAVAINYFAYSFIKIHRSLRVTPAMEAMILDDRA